MKSRLRRLRGWEGSVDVAKIASVVAVKCADVGRLSQGIDGMTLFVFYL